jgi:gas vesicle protein
VPILALSFITAGCEKSDTNPDGTPRTSADEVGDEIRDAAETAGKYIKEQADAFRTAMAEKWDDMSDDLENFKARAEAKKAEWSESLKQKMQDLDEKKAAFKQKMDELKNASGDAWGDAKQGAEDAWAELKEAYRDVKDEFKEENPPTDEE